jgi:glycogen synthase
VFLCVFLYRFHHTSGILNGIDMKEWDPMNDKYILPITFSKEDPSGKAQAKAKLQKELVLTLQRMCVSKCTRILTCVSLNVLGY